MGHDSRILAHLWVNPGFSDCYVSLRHIHVLKCAGSLERREGEGVWEGFPLRMEGSANAFSWKFYLYTELAHSDKLHALFMTSKKLNCDTTRTKKQHITWMYERDVCIYCTVLYCTDYCYLGDFWVLEYSGQWNSNLINSVYFSF